MVNSRAGLTVSKALVTEIHTVHAALKIITYFFLNRKGQRQASDNERQKKNVRKKRHIK